MGFGEHPSHWIEKCDSGGIYASGNTYFHSQTRIMLLMVASFGQYDLRDAKQDVIWQEIEYLPQV